MVMPKGHQLNRTFNYVRGEVEIKRLCQRPVRQPGVAPECEDAKESAVKGVTLPRLKFLEGNEGGK